MIKIGIVGAAGRMGRNLLVAVENNKNLQLAAAIVNPSSSLVGCDVGELVGLGKTDIKIVGNITEIIEDIDVLIDFSTPSVTLTNTKLCVETNKAIVIGTTGFTEKEKKEIECCSASIPLVFAPNFSVGVNLMFNLLEQATKVMGGYADIEIIEAHHRNKVDAPSGTALKMGEVIASCLDKDLKDIAVMSREGIIGPRKSGEIGFSTIRAADIVGKHTALFADIGESIEIKHNATSRMTFANGAVRAAHWLADKSSGFYSMQDVLGL